MADAGASEPGRVGARPVGARPRRRRRRRRPRRPSAGASDDSSFSLPLRRLKVVPTTALAAQRGARAALGAVDVVGLAHREHHLLRRAAVQLAQAGREAARWFAITVNLAILIATLTMILETLPELQSESDAILAFEVIEFVGVAIFTRAPDQDRRRRRPARSAG